jgi:hypothetical protein
MASGTASSADPATCCCVSPTEGAESLAQKTGPGSGMAAGYACCRPGYTTIGNFAHNGGKCIRAWLCDQTLKDS